jgi:hypothetical protein
MYFAGLRLANSAPSSSLRKTQVTDVSKLLEQFPGNDVFHESASAGQDKTVITYLEKEKALADRGDLRYNGLTNNCGQIARSP